MNNVVEVIRICFKIDLIVWKLKENNLTWSEWKALK